jgi:hypothetical protein
MYHFILVALNPAVGATVVPVPQPDQQAVPNQHVADFVDFGIAATPAILNWGDSGIPLLSALREYGMFCVSILSP